uniref:Lysosomal-associated transmembrane protein 4B n=1 Tax=Plectus sambesii TaxID=2011161 RepID=A0A914X330_9BILA
MRSTDAITMDYEQGTGFNENSPRYMCCCNSIHIKTGTLIIAILAVTGPVLNFLSTAGRMQSINPDGSISSLVIGGAAVACVFYALYAQRAAFLLPFMILQAIKIIGFIALIILFIFVLAGAEFPETVRREAAGEETISIDIKMIISILIAFYAIIISFSLWFLWVVYKCYVFFRDQADFTINNTASVGFRINANPNSYKRYT